MERIEKLFDKSREFYRGSDFACVRRIVDLCEWLAGHEGADIELLVAASIVHAAHPSVQDAPELAFEKRRSLGRSRTLLGECGFDETEVSTISAIIEESLQGTPTSVEAMILHDAISLDGLGAVGIIRALGSEAVLTPSFYEASNSPSELQLRGGKQSVFDRLVDKASAVPRVWTATGEREAKRRIEFMGLFIDQLRGELFPHGLVESATPPMAELEL